jgi:hypothetical protein
MESYILLYKDITLSTYIQLNRLKWAGHVIMMEDTASQRRYQEKVLEEKDQ